MLFFKVRRFDTISSIPAVAAASIYISSSDTADFRCQLSLIARTIPAAAPTLAAAIAACFLLLQDISALRNIATILQILGIEGFRGLGASTKYTDSNAGTGTVAQSPCTEKAERFELEFNVLSARKF